MCYTVWIAIEQFVANEFILYACENDGRPVKYANDEILLWNCSTKCSSGMLLWNAPMECSSGMLLWNALRNGQHTMEYSFGMLRCNASLNTPLYALRPLIDVYIRSF